MIVSGEQGRDSAIHIHASILPQVPFPSRLPHNIKQSSVEHNFYRAINREIEIDLVHIFISISTTLNIQIITLEVKTCSSHHI